MVVPVRFASWLIRPQNCHVRQEMLHFCAGIREIFITVHRNELRCSHNPLPVKRLQIFSRFEFAGQVVIVPLEFELQPALQRSAGGQGRSCFMVPQDDRRRISFLLWENYGCYLSE
jgi:hypothetical protein